MKYLKFFPKIIKESLYDFKDKLCKGITSEEYAKLKRDHESDFFKKGEVDIIKEICELLHFKIDEIGGDINFTRDKNIRLLRNSKHDDISRIDFKMHKDDWISIYIQMYNGEGAKWKFRQHFLLCDSKDGLIEIRDNISKILTNDPKYMFIKRTQKNMTLSSRDDMFKDNDWIFNIIRKSFYII